MSLPPPPFPSDLCAGLGPFVPVPHWACKTCSYRAPNGETQRRWSMSGQKKHTDTYAWKNAKNHSEIWDSNLLTKAVIHLVHVCRGLIALRHSYMLNRGTWTRARTSREHLPAPLSLSIWHEERRVRLQTQPSKQIQFSVCTATHCTGVTSDIINTTGVTENSDTISLCFFLLLQMCVKLPEQGWAGTHTPFVKSNDAEGTDRGGRFPRSMGGVLDLSPIPNDRAPTWKAGYILSKLTWR